MSSPTFDLQSHSIHSDGALDAATVVANAAEAGVELLALSDHDTVDGVLEAQEAARATGVRLVRAAELSSVYERWEDLHILGYGVEIEDETFRARLEDARSDRERRADRMADLLKELGWEIDPAPVRARLDAGKPVGRPHLAGAVLAHPANAERLEAENVNDVSSFIPAYLIPGAPAYQARTHPTVFEAIEWIHEAGGLAVWAHPFWDVENGEDVLRNLETFRAAGLDGVEAFYVTHTREQTHLLVDAAAEHDLLTTGSSDYHGPDHRLFSRFLAFDLHGREPALGPIADGLAS
jgi:predicted metal-dependent phosphoesterase TrpH